MDEMLRNKGRGIQFWWSVQVKYSTTLMNTVENDDEKKWFGSGHDEDDDEDDDNETPLHLHSGKLRIPNRDQLPQKMEEARQILIERNSGSIRGKSNVDIDSIGNVCFKSVNNAKRLN